LIPRYERQPNAAAGLAALRERGVRAQCTHEDSSTVNGIAIWKKSS
jgi:hypothetical protein